MLTTGILDPERETTLDEVLATLELPVQRFWAELAAEGEWKANGAIHISARRVGRRANPPQRLAIGGLRSADPPYPALHQRSEQGPPIVL